MKSKLSILYLVFSYNLLVKYMDELLKIYYGIDIKIDKIFDKIIFTYKNNDYILIKEKYIDFDLINYLLSFSYINKPIVNTYDSYITEYQDSYYLLFYYNEYKININDINIFLNQNINIIDNHTYEKWCKKIDYHEYQITQFGARYLKLRKSINYVVGLSEIGIQLLNTIDLNMCYSCYVHKRISDSLFEFKNPLNICIDYRIRDLSEYIKYMFFYKDQEIFNEVIKNIKLTIEEYKLLFARLLLITPYYDMYESIIDEKKDEKEIEIIVNKLNNYENYIKKIYLYLKRYINIDTIELFND